MDRGFEHPVRAFNDTLGFQKTTVYYFGRAAEFEDKLSEGQTHDLKEQMKIAIVRFHIAFNKEIRNTHSDRSRMRFKFKDSICR